MKKLFFLLLVTSLCLAQASPKDLQHSVTQLDFSFKLTGTGAGFLKTLAFLNTTQQFVSVESNTPFTVEDGKYGSKYYAFSFIGNKQIDLKITADVDYSRARDKVIDASVFLQPSKLVIIDSSIASTAASITVNAKSDLEKAVLLTEWAYNNVEYDESYWGKNEVSTTVFKEKRGVCVEYSHLLIALLRSQDIPARLVAGWVYSGKQWDPHGWVEAGINGEWIPLDPTFGEAIVLNGGHVVFGYGRDQSDVSESLTNGFQLEKFSEVETKSNTAFNKFFEASFQDFPEKAGSNSIIDFKVKVKNSLNEPIAVPLVLIVPLKPDDLKIVKLTDNKIVFLNPLQEKIVSFKTKTPVLDEAYSYNFSIGLRSLGFSVFKNLTASAFVEQNYLSEVAVSGLSYEVSPFDAKIIVELTNFFNEPAVGTAFLSLSGEEKPFSIHALGKQKIEFSLPLDSETKGELSIKAFNKTLRQPVLLDKPPETIIREDPMSQYGFYAMILICVVALLFLLKRLFF
ncbi:transglutaminase domain-containing protein [Candidatus Micrarchaeota archaeon]|nr:transglutaminase domain-containing protein [Candidatus Micrarchaeota archaeon]